MTKPEPNFKVGDVVQLRSGGHYMTVERIACHEVEVTVVWSSDGAICTEELDICLIQHAPEVPF